MKNKFIKIDNISDIKMFVDLAGQLPTGNTWASQGQTRVRGNSLMGMFAIDTASGFYIEYPETATEFDEFVTRFEINNK